MTALPPAPPRRPYAFGLTSWGPLPGTGDLHLMWDGPASPLFLLKGDLGITRIRHQVRHPAACGMYVTWQQAERAVRELTAVWLAAEQAESGETR